MIADILKWGRQLRTYEEYYEIAERCGHLRAAFWWRAGERRARKASVRVRGELREWKKGELDDYGDRVSQLQTLVEKCNRAVEKKYTD